MPKRKQPPCACAENDYDGKCGVCILKKMEKPPPREIKKPNKQGVCDCLDYPSNGFRYVAHELIDGVVVDVEYVKCDNCKLKLVDLNNVNPGKLHKVIVVEKTDLPNMVWAEWCTHQCTNQVWKLSKK